MTVSNSILLLAASVAVSSFSQVLLKKSAGIHYENHLREYLNPYVSSGYILMVASTFLSLLAFRLGAEFKFSPVIEALGYGLVMVFSRLFFGEKITKRKLLGNLIILSGIAVFCL